MLEEKKPKNLDKIINVPIFDEIVVKLINSGPPC